MMMMMMMDTLKLKVRLIDGLLLWLFGCTREVLDASIVSYLTEDPGDMSTAGAGGFAPFF